MATFPSFYNDGHTIALTSGTHVLNQKILGGLLDPVSGLGSQTSVPTSVVLTFHWNANLQSAQIAWSSVLNPASWEVTIYDSNSEVIFQDTPTGTLRVSQFDGSTTLFTSSQPYTASVTPVGGTGSASEVFGSAAIFP